MKHKTHAFISDRVLSQEEKRIEEERFLAQLSAQPKSPKDIRISWLIVGQQSIIVVTYMEQDK